eukprot:TRINITY_DN145_c1_g1_i1.p1 TRINITY_DN145_c1_g1~~TRINITY_DN145_c1_g1_i1.p1  ORF type:complete len:206 (+),score=30.08 TRINITY_DN145_c1_g1_i1:192-809(+)
MQPEAGQPLYQMSHSFDPGGGAGHGSPGLGQRQHDQFGFRPASATPAPPTTPGYSAGADYHIPAAPQYPPLMTHPALQHQQQPPPVHMMGMHSMMMPQHPHQFQHMGGPHDLPHGLPPPLAQQHQQQQQQHQQWAGHTLWDRHVECAGSGSAMQEVHEATAPASASASAGAASTIAGQVHSGAALVQAAASSASNREGRTRIVSL